MEFSDFQKVARNGYYFDYCVDLVFYDSAYGFLAQIKTPEQGFKPEITVKGTMIEGSYAINSFVTVRNMSYEIDINRIAYIACRMYYSGLNAPNPSKSLYKQEKDNGGHKVLFSVLYADQEGEPPNRAVRFQCCVAATDFTRTGNVKVFTGKDGNIYGTKEEANKNSPSSKAKLTGTFKEILKSIAKIYNDSIKKELVDTDLKAEQLTIKEIIVQHKDWVDGSGSQNYQKAQRISLGSSTSNILEAIRMLNSIKASGYEEECWRIYISQTNSLVVEILEPKFRDQVEDYETKYKYDPTTIKVGENASGEATERVTDNVSLGNSIESPVMLNYVKGAYRNEVIIYATTMFDDRIKPGCFCAIKGNAIMGRVGKGGGRITDAHKNKTVVFRATGSIEYEFSTTRGGQLKIIGPVVAEKQDKELLFLNQGN